MYQIVKVNHVPHRQYQQQTPKKLFPNKRKSAGVSKEGEASEDIAMGILKKNQTRKKRMRLTNMVDKPRMRYVLLIRRWLSLGPN